VSQKDAAALILGAETKGTVQSTSTVQNGTSTVQDKFSPLDYLEADHITVEAFGLSQETAEALGIGYAPKGMMKGYVAIPISHISQEECVKKAPRSCGAFSFTC
jgi:hypothetical protein